MNDPVELVLAWKDDLVQLLRSRTAEVFRLVFAVEHELNTICWFALHAPSKITDLRVDRYEQNVQALLPQINGVLAEIAGMNARLYQRLRTWTEQLDELEGRIALLLHSERAAEDISALAQELAAVRLFFHALPDDMGHLLLTIGAFVPDRR